MNRLHAGRAHPGFFRRTPGLTGLLFLTVALVLGGCFGRQKVSELHSYQRWQTITPPKPTKPLANKLRLLIWHDYLDPDILEFFEKTYGVELEITYFKNNSDLKAKFAASPDGYDLLMPSSYVVERLIKADAIAKIDKENIPNLANVSPVFFQAEYDRELVHSVPIFYSYLGIAFNGDYLRRLPKNFNLTSESSEENLLLFGYRALLEESRITLASALLDNGYDPNTKDPEAVRDVANELIKASAENGIRFIADDLPRALGRNEILIAACWSGAAGYALSLNPAIRFVLPSGKKFLEVDSMVIPKTSPAKYTAEFFLNFLLIPEITGDCSNYSYYANTNDASRPYIEREILIGPSYISAPAGSSIFLRDLGEAEAIYDEEWQRMHLLKEPINAKVPLRTSPRATAVKADRKH